MVNEGKIDEANAVVAGGKTHGRNWLVGRQGKKLEKKSTSAPTDGYVQELTTKIRQELEADLEAKVNRKVKENMSFMLTKLGEANPDLNFNLGDFCPIASSDQDDNGTPITPGATGF